MLTEEQVQVIQRWSAVASLLSIAGSCFVIGSYGVLVRLRHFTMKMVCILSSLDLVLQSVRMCKWVLGVDRSAKEACGAFAFAEQALFLPPQLWCSCIAGCLLYAAFRNKPNRVIMRQLNHYALASVGVPLAMAGLGAGLGAQGASPVLECDIEPGLASLCLVYAPLLLMAAFNIVSVMFVWRHESKQAGSSFQNAAVLRYLAYPIVVSTLALPPIVEACLLATARGGNAGPHPAPPFAVALASSISRHAQGFFVALLFSCDKLILSELTVSAVQLMPCSRDAAEPARPSVALAPAAARQQAEAPVELRVLREAAGPGLPAAAAADGGKAFGEEDDGKSEESLPSYMRADMSDSGAFGNSQDSRLDETYPSLSPERLASHELL